MDAELDRTNEVAGLHVLRSGWERKSIRRWTVREAGTGDGGRNTETCKNNIERKRGREGGERRRRREEEEGKDFTDKQTHGTQTN